MHESGSFIAAFPERSQEPETGITFPAYPLIDESPNANQFSGTYTGYAPLVLGQPVIDKYGFRHLYVRARAALAAGNVVTLAANVTGTVQAPAGVADNVSIILANHAGITAGGEVGNFLGFSNATGEVGAIKLIKANTATSGGNVQYTISRGSILQGLNRADGDAFAAAVATGTNVQLIRPYNVAVAGAASLPMGIAQGVVTSGNNTLVQYTGLALALYPTGQALVDGDLVTSAASGKFIEFAAGAEHLVGGVAKNAITTDADTLVPTWLVEMETRW